MSHLIRVSFPALRNSEYPLVVNRVIGIVEAHKPESLRLQRSFDRLAAFRSQLDKIEAQERADSESAPLHELDHERDTLIGGIHSISEYFHRMPVVRVSEPAALVLAALKKHGSSIAADNYTAETKRLYDLEADLAAQPEVIKAMDALMLKPLFERLNEANREFDRLFMQRSQHQAEVERVDARAIRVECDRAVSKLWEAIEYNIDEYGEEEYRPLVAAINALNAYYRQQLAARAARKKAKQDVSKEEPIRPENA